jgi:hypothetical protein
MTVVAPALLFPGHIDSRFVAAVKAQAERGVFDGRIGIGGQLPLYVQRSIHNCPNTKTRLIYTRDTGHHTSGWWKNPDYERCYHLSLSWDDGHKTKLAERWARAFFGSNVNLIWIEPPYSAAGKARETWHYRLFCDTGWQPIKPRGEVYDTAWTPADWRSWSDLHGEDRNATSEA